MKKINISWEIQYVDEIISPPMKMKLADIEAIVQPNVKPGRFHILKD